MTSMRLYNKIECPFCWKVRLALSELGLAVEIVDHEEVARQGEWHALSPRRTVPVLVSGDTAIYESNVILEFLQDFSGELLPKPMAQRAQARLLNQYSDGTIGAALREVIFEKRGKPEVQWDRARIDAGVKAFHKALAYLSEQLGDREYFTDRYAFPECALTARFGLAQAYGVDIPEDFANLGAWFSRMKERASYAATAPARALAN